MSFKLPDKYRAKLTMDQLRHFGGNDWDDCGMFYIPIKKSNSPLKVIASSGEADISEGWDHASISLPTRCPTWDEMCKVKDLFWDKEDTVIQYHPPESEYINNHPYCLHLWRHVSKTFPMPPKIMVGR